MTAAAGPLDASSATAESGRNDATTATTATNESRVLNDKFYGSITKATEYESWEEKNVIIQALTESLS